MSLSSCGLILALLCFSAYVHAEPIRIGLEKQQLQLSTLKRQHAALKAKMLQNNGAAGEADITIYNFMDAQVNTCARRQLKGLLLAAAFCSTAWSASCFFPHEYLVLCKPRLHSTDFAKSGHFSLDLCGSVQRTSSVLACFQIGFSETHEFM